MASNVVAEIFVIWACLDPDAAATVCINSVEWNCTGTPCLSQSRGYYTYSGTFSYQDVDYINSWPWNGSPDNRECCGDDLGEEPLQTSWCSGYCDAGEVYLGNCVCQKT